MEDARRRIVHSIVSRTKLQTKPNKDYSIEIAPPYP